MTHTTRNPLSDLRSVSRMAVDATLGLTDLVEAMHYSVAYVPAILDKSRQGRTLGITGLVYRSIRGVTRLVGEGIDVALARLAPMLGERSSSPVREAILAALNGVLGDYLAASTNALAIPMGLRRNGVPLPVERQALAGAIPEPGGKLLVLVHGLCLNDLQWSRQGHDHGQVLARDLAHTPVYLHYNTGLHISTNGRAFADLMDALVAQWPVRLQELAIVAHSMGGLVVRSACYYGAAAGHRWLRPLRKIVFLGTPHHGAPLERAGNWVDVLLGKTPYTAPFARLGKIRSAGITDLRHGNLLDEDWEGHDRFAHLEDRRRAVPLPEGVQCCALAASTGNRPGDISERVLGDGLIPLDSALGRHRDPARRLSFPESCQWVGYGMNHLGLLSRPEVYERIRRYLA
jgi:hypothetical protein